MIYRVEQSQRTLALAHGRGAGPERLGAADQVVAVDDAIAFFTDYIRANPDDPAGYTMREHSSGGR